MEYLVTSLGAISVCQVSVYFPWIQQWCCTGLLEAAVELELSRLATFPACMGIDEGRRPRCSKCHVPVADLRQGYVRAVLGTLLVWAGGNRAEIKVALLTFPPCVAHRQTWTAHLLGFSTFVLCFYLHLWKQGYVEVCMFFLEVAKTWFFFFLFIVFLICILSNTLSRWIHVPMTKIYVMKSRPAFTLNISSPKK